MRARLLSFLIPLVAAAAAPRVSADESSDSGETASSAPELSLSVTHNGPKLPWQMELRNEGSAPVVLSADPRLLWFEVKVPGKKRTVTCRLPKELFPDRPEREARLWLAAGEVAGKGFDPRLYCFSEGGQWQLVPGSQITPHFGWPEKTKTSWKQGKRVETVIDEPPYVARTARYRRAKDAKETAEEDEGGHVKVIEGNTFALDSSYAAWARSRLPDPDEDKGPFVMKLTAGSDASVERTATVRLTLKNRSKRSRHVYFRRELVSFEVMGPDGLVQCDPEPDLRAPERHSFSYLPAGTSLRVTSRLVELCPRGTFGRPGLYLVHARFDSFQPGDDFDLDAFVGRVITRDAVGVRIRKGEKKPLRLRRIRVQPATESADSE